MRSIVLSVLVVMVACSGQRMAVAREPVRPDDVAVRALGEHLVRSTTKKLPDGSSRIVINELNGWHYWTLMIYEGMNRMAAVRPEPLFERYTPDRLDYLVDELAKNPRPGGSLRFYPKWDQLWCTGIAHIWFERAIATGGEPYQDYIRRFAAFVDTCPRVDDRLLANYGFQVRTDDAYLMVPAMLRLATIEGRPDRTDDALHQLIGYHRRLFQENDALYRHIWDARSDTYAAAYWGRGNSWMALAHVDVLGYLPADHPRRGELLEIYREQMAGLRRYQAEAGGWRQVIDHPESWVETSCTGMFTYALARGVREGWLDASYAEDARRGWRALVAKVEADGVTIDTCPGTGPGNLQHYLDRPRQRDDPHSYGPVLLAGSEMLRLEKTD